MAAAISGAREGGATVQVSSRLATTRAGARTRSGRASNTVSPECPTTDTDSVSTMPASSPSRALEPTAIAAIEPWLVPIAQSGRSVSVCA